MIWADSLSLKFGEKPFHLITRRLTETSPANSTQLLEMKNFIERIIHHICFIMSLGMLPEPYNLIGRNCYMINHRLTLAIDIENQCEHVIWSYK